MPIISANAPSSEQKSFPGPVALAPMSGITDRAFRRIAARFGAPLVVSEMVASREFLTRKQESLLRAENAGITPHIVQIAGCDPEIMGEAARLAEASGADIVDINMGCPAKKVTGQWAGAALMRDADLAVSIVASVRRAIKVPVTVKMRLGWTSEQLTAPDLARRVAEAGAQMITVHGRTRDQFYGGRANWAAIRAVKEAVAVPVVANGDIDSIAAARAALDQSGADLVMIGRAAMGRPWLVGAVARELLGDDPKPPSQSERIEAMVEHYEDLLRQFGREKGVRHARKHLVSYAEAAARDHFVIAPADRLLLSQSENPVEVLAVLKRLYAISAPQGLAA